MNSVLISSSSEVLSGAVRKALESLISAPVVTVEDVVSVTPQDWERCGVFLSDTPDAQAVSRKQAPDAAALSIVDACQRLESLAPYLDRLTDLRDPRDRAREAELELDAAVEERMWHDLQNGTSIEKNLEILRLLGQDADVRDYKKKWDENPATAKDFARERFKGLRDRGGRLSPTAMSEEKGPTVDPSKTIRVLVVDDKKYWVSWLKPPVELINSRFPSTDIELVHAPGKECAKEILKFEHIDAVIIDYILGNGSPSDALELAEWVSEEYKDIPTFGLTGYIPRLNSHEEWETVKRLWNVKRVFYKEIDEASEPYDLLHAIRHAFIAKHEVVAKVEPDLTPFIRVVAFSRTGDLSRTVQEHWNGLPTPAKPRIDLDILKASTVGRAERLLLRYGVHALVVATDIDEEILKRIGEFVREIRPEVQVYRAIEKSPDFTYVRVNSGLRQNFKEFIESLERSVKERAVTPFFSALEKYAQRPTAVFHALPLSRGKGISASQWAGRFWDFYGDGYFAAETSSTMMPLDSLFYPHSTLKESMELAAAAFHADRTQFCTNGTTGANTIVYRALLKPGDLILQDRNCHLSHHCAAVAARANVSYLEPHHLDKLGISTIVPMQRLREQLEQFPRGTIKLIALTHPTFDGVCYSPEAVMRMVYDYDSSIAMLFDEAWFGYAAFHPAYRHLSAMCAAEKLREEGIDVRVYVTQSTHKTLSAMRQGSMIHIRDPRFEKEVKWAFDEAVKALTTTSPNASILASLDVARMQASMEGFDRISRARSIARWLRHELRVGSPSAITGEDLLNGLEPGEAAFDPLKLTIDCGGLSGHTVQNGYFHERYGIQVNKYSHNSVLVLVTIATTWSMADYLVRCVRELPAVPPRADAPPDIPRFSGFHPRFHDLDAGGKELCQSGKVANAFDELVRLNRTELEKLECHVDKSPDVPHDAIAVSYVTPYPPGFPVLVPGQLLERQCLEYLAALIRNGVQDIHGLKVDGDNFSLPYTVLKAT